MRETTAVTNSQRGIAPWQVPAEFRPRVRGYIARDDGLFERDWRIDLPPNSIRPKAWATAMTLSGGPASVATGQTTITTLSGVDTGDSIVLMALWSSATITLNQITITGESDATLLTARGPSSPDNTRSRFAYLANVTAGGSKDCTFNFSATTGGSGVQAAIAFAGGDTSSFSDAENYATGTSATASVSVTTTQATDLLVAIGNNNNGGATEGSGYTAIALADNHWYIHGEYKLDAGAAGAKTVDMSLPGSGAWTINAAAFKAAVPDAGGPVTVGASGSAVTVGRGTAAPVTSIGL